MMLLLLLLMVMMMMMMTIQKPTNRQLQLPAASERVASVCRHWSVCCNVVSRNG